MKKLTIEVSDELKQAWPQFRGAAVFATVKNTAYNEELWKYAQAAGKQIYTAEAWKNTRIGE